MSNYRKRKTALLICVAILSVIVIVLATVCVLVFTGVIDGGKKEPVQGKEKTTVAEQPAEPAQGGDASGQEAADKAPDKQETVDKKETAEEEPVQMYVANVEHAVYLRSAPNESDDNIITTVPVRTAVTFLKNETAVFAKVYYNGKEGYIKREYLSTQYPSNPANNGNTTVTKYVYVANVPNSIYMRSTASETSGNVITTIPVGTEVGYIEKTNSVFSKIQYNGQIGYVKSKYLADYVDSSAGSYMVVCNVENSIYLRSSAEETSSNIITTIPVGERVEYINSGNGTFYIISWNGKTGYAKAKFLRFV